MNTIRLDPSSTSLKGRILAIEPDAARARALRELLKTRIDGHVEIVTSTEGALVSIGRLIPDVVLTSTFLSPSDECALTTHLKSLPAAAHVPVIITPHFIDGAETPRTVVSHMFGRRKPRSTDVRPSCEPGTFVRQIEEYIGQARAQAALATDEELRAALGAAPPMPHEFTEDIRIVRAQAAIDLESIGSLVPRRGGLVRPSDRRREKRHHRDELPGLWSAKLPWGTEVKLVDVSKRGVLVETTSRVTLGSTLDLQFVGQDAQVSIPARILRTDVADVTGLGVRYRVAASFTRDLEILQTAAAARSATAKPAALAEMLARVLADVETRPDSAVPHARFEEELGKLLPVRSIQIRRTPLASTGDESIYFQVPGGSGSPILQAIFEPNTVPSAEDFKLLKAAASLAAVVLEFAPFPEDRGIHLAARR
jgi:hypothetical protein